MTTATATDTRKPKRARAVPFNLFFDGGGNILLQSPRYVHSYDDPAQAADDVKAMLAGDNGDGWDGHEPECRMTVGVDGGNGCHWYSRGAVLGLMAGGEPLNLYGAGRAERAFFTALTGKAHLDDLDLNEDGYYRVVTVVSRHSFLSGAQAAVAHCNAVSQGTATMIIEQIDEDGRWSAPDAD